ncbi:MAG: TfoX/Sxy family protein [Rhodothermales bacterium]|nr:TfoX/Sxy family protein [Rhodothermales bacterium]
MAFNPILAERLRKAFDGVDVVEKKMFGGLAIMYKDYMCCGILDDRLMLRVPKETHDRYLAMPFVEKMDFTGRPMKGFVYIIPEGITTNADLQGWVEMAIKTVESFPEKEK